MNTHVIETTWSDKDWDKFTVWLKEMLQVSPVTVTFTKKDGSERVMNCTLQPSELPPQVVNENKKERKKSDDTLAVYDLDAKAWRSFTIKSIKNVKLSIE